MLPLKIRTAFQFSSLPCIQSLRLRSGPYLREPIARSISATTMSPNEVIEYNYIHGVERLDKYKPGGYYPIMINDVLHNRYRIVDKLGFGGYSTIWLARDDRLNHYVAIKVNISNPSLPNPQRESNVLRALSGLRLTTAQNAPTTINGHDAIPRILDEFNIEGPNGTHICYTVAPAQGNLQEASFSRLFPIKVARALAAKLASAVSFVHSQGFVHGDIHLRNVLVGLPSTFDELSVDQFKEKFGEPEAESISRMDGKPLPPNVPIKAVVPLYLGKKAQEFTLADANSLILSDFGEAFAPAVEQRLGRDCHTPLSKGAPEALLQPDAPLTYSSDIWSLGNAIWEIVAMRPLFSDCEGQDEIVAEQIDVFGYQNFPLKWRGQWERQDSEKESTDQPLPRRPLRKRDVWSPLEVAFEEDVQVFRKEKEDVVGIFSEEETRAFLDLMRGMMVFQPEKRMTIDEVLKSEWMSKWALPQISAHDVVPTAN